ncbi:uncharacterized protein LOC117651976 [Thrips palmi]|uniref:Uncharacterized protein LOC117651976 n=1 Tax=Thrips palmi TaxID=161013 RepID=A0A6P9A5I4_THRPL|nr:uncharacterized protein LOC117651976 [Thrips palmi]
MAECTPASSSWSNVSRGSQRYRDLDTAAMHFWIDKRGATGSVPHHGGRYSQRVSASLSSSRLPPGAAQQRRRRPGRSSRSSSQNAAKTTAPGVHRGNGDASSSGTTTAPSALTAAGLVASSGASGGSRGSTGSGIRPHGHPALLVDIPLDGPHAHHAHHAALHHASAGGMASDRADMFGIGALPLPVHESPPVLMDRFTCGLWASFALASVFVAGTKFYLDFQSSGMEAMVLSLLLMIFLMVGCTASICRARVNSQLAAAAAAATASALRDPGPGALRRGHLGDSGDLVVMSQVVIDRPGMDSSCPGLGTGQPTQQHQLLQQVQQEQLAEQQLSTEPPPPYHIAMLDEQPPPAYEKVVT